MFKETLSNTVRGVCPYAVRQNVIDNLDEHPASLASAEIHTLFFPSESQNLL